MYPWTDIRDFIYLQATGDSPLHFLNILVIAYLTIIAYEQCYYRLVELYFFFKSQSAKKGAAFSSFLFASGLQLFNQKHLRITNSE